jgi:hypothetical protein
VALYRNYEESTITDVFNKGALSTSLRERLSKGMLSLVDAVSAFFTPGSPYLQIMDSNATLKYHQDVELLSLHSLKMFPAALKRSKSVWSSSGSDQGELLPFEADIANSRMKQKCFTTYSIDKAQVRCVQGLSCSTAGVGFHVDVCIFMHAACN